MALSATTATTRSTMAARASAGSKTEPSPGTPRKARPPASTAARRTGDERAAEGTAAERRLMGIDLSSHIGAGLLRYKVSRRPVAVVVTEQHVAAIFLVGLIFQLADHPH